jgi:hypothetical protein
MAEIRSERRLFAKGMNKDKDPRFMENGEYFDALNIRILSNAAAGQAGAAVKVKSSLVLSPTDGNTIAVNTECVLAYDFSEKRCLYLGLATPNTSGEIWEYNYETGYFRRLLVGTLNFKKGVIINGVVGIDDYLVWADPAGEPKCISISKAALGFYTDVQTQFPNIAYILYPAQPIIPPIGYVSSDPFYQANNIYGKYFQFSYRYVYWDNRKSSWSTYSKAVRDVRTTQTTNITTSGVFNKISLKLKLPSSTDTKQFLKAVEIAVRDVSENNTGLWKFVRQINLTDLDSDVDTYNDEVRLAFYNDKVYPQLDQQEFTKLFDYVPKKAADLVLASENRILFGNCEFDYNLYPEDNGVVENAVKTSVEPIYRDPKDTTTVTTALGLTASDTVLTVTGLPNILALGDNLTVIINQTAAGIIPAASTSLSMYIGNHLITGFDICYEVYYIIKKGKQTRFFADAGITVTTSLTTTSNIITLAAGTGTFGASVSRSGRDRIPEQTHSRIQPHPYGIAYFDSIGRTTAVYTTENMTNSPQWFSSAGASKTGRVDMRLKIQHLAPIGAEYFAVMYARAPIAQNMITVKVDTAIFDAVTNTTTFTLSTGQTLITNQLLKLNIPYSTNYVAQPVGRVGTGVINGVTTNYRIVNTGSNTVTVEGDVSTILGAWTNFIRIIPAGLSQTNDFIYYEIGDVYKVTNRLHTPKTVIWGGLDYDPLLNATDQSSPSDDTGGVNIYGGDVFYRGVETGLAGFQYEMPIYSPYYNSKCFDAGRVNLVDKSYKNQIRETYVGATQPYVFGATVNGLGTAYPTNFKEYDNNFGAITRIWYDERVLTVLQQLKVGQAMLGQDILKTASGSDLVTTSDKYFGDLNYSTDDFGIFMHGESLAVNAGQKFWVDVPRKAVCRQSQDGITDISNAGLKSFFTALFDGVLGSPTDYKGRNIRLFGTYDRRNNEYVLYIRQQPYQVIYVLDSTQVIDGEELTTETDFLYIGGELTSGTYDLYTPTGVFVTTVAITVSGGSTTSSQLVPVGEYLIYNPTSPYVNIVCLAYSDVNRAWTTRYDFGENILNGSTTRLSRLFSYGVDLAYHINTDTVSTNVTNIKLANKGSTFLPAMIDVFFNQEEKFKKFFTGVKFEVDIFKTPAPYAEWSKWYADETSAQSCKVTTPSGQTTYIRPANLTNVEGFYRGEIKNDRNTLGFSHPTEAEINGNPMRDYVLEVKIENTDTNNAAKLFAVEIYYNVSHQSGGDG